MIKNTETLLKMKNIFMKWYFLKNEPCWRFGRAVTSDIRGDRFDVWGSFLENTDIKKNPMTSCLSLLTWILSPRGAAASRDPLVKGVSDKEKLLDKSFASIRLVAPAPLLSPLPGHCKLCQSTSFSWNIGRALLSSEEPFSLSFDKFAAPLR